MAVEEITIYHNPRCSKSRAALALIEASGLTPRIVEYLKNPPSAAELRTIVQRLGVRPEALVRKNEDLYKQQFAGQQHSDLEWLDILARNPVLIERPIVVRGNHAAIGRPPENIAALLT
jgi:arsenate reductase